MILQFQICAGNLRCYIENSKLQSFPQATWHRLGQNPQGSMIQAEKKVLTDSARHRLTDIVRDTIIFEDVTDMYQGLRLLEEEMPCT